MVDNTFFPFQVLEEFSQPDETVDYYTAQNEENEDKNRYPSIIPSMFIDTYVSIPLHIVISMIVTYSYMQIYQR